MPLPTPQINEENRAFWTGGADGELRFTRCQSCGYYLHPPSPRCPECWSDDDGSGSGQRPRDGLHVHDQPPQWMPGLEVPFVLAVVELDEQPGLRLIARHRRLRAEEPTIGMSSTSPSRPRGDAFIPFFRPVS